MVWWVKLAWYVFTVLVSAALAPRPKGPRAATIDDFELPTAELGRPMPVIFGTVDVTGPNVVWYGDLDIQKIKKSSLFGSTTVGFRYYLGFHAKYCHGPIDAITRIAWGDKEAWTGNVTANSTINIDKSELFGGKQRGGGIVGDFDALFGESTQTANSYLTAQQAGLQPAHRGVFSLVWKGGYIGTASYVQPLTVRLRRILKGWQDNLIWYSAKANINGGMNPAHIIYECLTNKEWGMGAPTSTIDTAKFTTAADTLFTEGFGLNIIWNQASTVEQFMQIIMNHIQGAVGLNNSTGKYELVLMRGDYNPATLTVFNPSNCKLEDFQRQGWGETVNEIILVYTDPDTGKDASISHQDLANIDAQQGTISETVELRGIKDHTLARTVLAREIATRTTPLSTATIVSDRTAWPIPYNGLLKLTWPDRKLTDVVYRVLNIDKGSAEDTSIRISLLQDIYALGISTYLGTQAAGSAPSSTPPPDDTEVPPNFIISAAIATPPSTPADGDRYLLPTSGLTGDWVGQGGKVAEWNEADSVWEYFDVPDGSLLYNIATSSYITVENGVSTPAPWAAGGINNQTGASYTLVLNDAGGTVRRNNAAANTTTVPNNSSVTFKIGTVIWVRQVGAGASSLVADGGVTLNGTLALPGQNREVKLTKVNTNEWDIGP